MFARIQFPRLPQYTTALIVSIVLLSVGSIAGWTGNTIYVLLAGQFNGIPINTTSLGWITSLPNLSSMIFCIGSGIICDKLGRKAGILIFTVPLILGWLLILFANNIDVLLIARFVIGMGGGPLYMLVPLYASEVAEKEIRARLASFFQLFLALGIFLSYVLGYLVDIRVFTALCAATPMLFFVLFAFQKESPIFQVMEKNYEEARSTLHHFRGESHDVDAELDEIKTGLQKKHTGLTLKESLRKRSFKIALLVSLCLCFFQQAAGVVVISFYTVEIFTSAGSTLNPQEATIAVGGLRVVAALVSSSIMDVFPRKTLLTISSSFSGVGLTVLGAYYTMKERNLVSDDTLSNFGFMPLVCLSIFTVTMSMGLSPLPPILAAELFPPETKGFGTSLAGAVTWFLLFVFSRFYSDVKSAVGGDGTFYIYAGACFACAIFVVFLVPETKGKSLEQIQCELNKRKRENSLFM